jgi:hypothetical protein
LARNAGLGGPLETQTAKAEMDIHGAFLIRLIIRVLYIEKKSDSG